MSKKRYKNIAMPPFVTHVAFSVSPGNRKLYYPKNPPLANAARICRFIASNYIYSIPQKDSVQKDLSLNNEIDFFKQFNAI